jgi:hypothetical protein
MLSSIFLVFALVLLIPIYFYVDWQKYQNSLPGKVNTIQVPNILPDNKPDIYYIVLDGYGRSDILQKYYHYDNSDFLEHLTGLGFIIPSEIHSNYAKTNVSVPSTLNLNYIHDIVEGVENTPFWWLMNPLVRESRVQLFLEDMGYTSISIASNWDTTNNPSASIFLDKRHTIDKKGYAVHPD